MAFKSDGFIASALSPVVPVKHESDEYYIYSYDSLIMPLTYRGNGAVANQATWNMSFSSYSLTEHALRDIVTDRDRNNADPGIKLDVDTTEYLTEKILMRREITLQQLVQTSTTWANSTSLTSTLAWTTNTTNPITQIDSAASVVVQTSGKTPNVVALSDTVFRTAKENTSTVDRIKYTSADSVTPMMLARLFNVDQVLVGKATQNTAEEGIDTVTMAFIWADTVFIGYVERAPGLKKPSALYTFQQEDSGNPYIVEKYREDARKGDWVEVSSIFSHVAPATGCGYIIEDVLQ